jgi:pimeloyl-ACP methyl ester carboxylesterase
MRFADIAEELVERLAPGGAVVVGNSVGGFAAGRLAVRRPELVRGLVLIDSGGFLGRGPQVRAFCSLMARPRFLRAIYPWFANRYMRPGSDADRRVRDVGIATTREDPGLRAVSELWASFASPEHDLRSEAGSIAAPTLVAWGKRDPVIPLKVGREIAATIPHAQLEVFDAGHSPQVSDPQGFAAKLVPFADAAFTDESSAKEAVA